MYSFALFAEFYSINDHQQRHVKYAKAPPHTLHFVDEEGAFHIVPFIYELKQELDMETLQRNYSRDHFESAIISSSSSRAMPYRLLGLIDTNIHLVGVDEPAVYFPFGTDELGRDLFSRTMYAARISLSIGFMGVVISFCLGCLIGGISGYFGGTVDLVIQRVIEFIISIPQIPLWMALAAALPPQWSSIQVYFGITIVLATVGWTTLARAVRGKLLELREADFRHGGAHLEYGRFRHHREALAAFIRQLSHRRAEPVGARHDSGRDRAEFPGNRHPAAGGQLGRAAARCAEYPQPEPESLAADTGLFVIVTVLAFNFLGDGLRDAADPYKQ